MKVAIAGRDEVRAKAAATELGDGAISVTADVADPEQVTRAIAEVEKALGPIDILVNNAGLTRDGLLVRMSDADWDIVLDANLKGAFNTMKAVTRGMMKRRDGRIINITSVVGITGNAGQANYAASKAGIIGLTRAIAQEVASRNITVNAVAPGFIETAMTEAISLEAREKLASRIPMGRLGQPSDVAGLVRFLASDDASYITGQVINVNGGMYM